MMLLTLLWTVICLSEESVVFTDILLQVDITILESQ